MKFPKFSPGRFHHGHHMSPRQRKRTAKTKRRRNKIAEYTPKAPEGFTVHTSFYDFHHRFGVAIQDADGNRSGIAKRGVYRCLTKNLNPAIIDGMVARCIDALVARPDPPPILGTLWAAYRIFRSRYAHEPTTLVLSRVGYDVLRREASPYLVFPKTSFGPPTFSGMIIRLSESIPEGHLRIEAGRECFETVWWIPT